MHSNKIGVTLATAGNDRQETIYYWENQLSIPCYHVRNLPDCWHPAMTGIANTTVPIAVFNPDHG